MEGVAAGTNNALDVYDRSRNAFENSLGNFRRFIKKEKLKRDPISHLIQMLMQDLRNFHASLELNVDEQLYDSLQLDAEVLVRGYMRDDPLFCNEFHICYTRWMGKASAQMGRVYRAYKGGVNGELLDQVKRNVPEGQITAFWLLRLARDYKYLKEQCETRVVEVVNKIKSVFEVQYNRLAVEIYQFPIPDMADEPADEHFIIPLS